MTAFSESFRSEVARIARKEVKDDVASLRKAVTAYRSEIAALKRDNKTQAAQLRSLAKAVEKLLSGAEAKAPRSTAPAKPGKPGKPGKPKATTFNHEALIAKREALGITQKQMAALIGASSLSVYKWETGKVSPRAAQLDRLQTVLKMGVREARAQLMNLSEEAST